MVDYHVSKMCNQRKNVNQEAYYNLRFVFIDQRWVWHSEDLYQLRVGFPCLFLHD